MSFNRAAAAAVLLAGAALAGCSGASKVLGGGSAPDEFRTVAMPPLTVPPDYSLRPPKPGEPRPQELQPESAARLAILGQREGLARSDGEKLLVARAGGDKADPLVRYVVDDEFGDIAHKDTGFANRVLFWRKDKASSPDQQAVAADQTPAPIDPAVEARQIKRLTGNQTVVIQRDKRKTTFIKLPGL